MNRSRYSSKTDSNTRLIIALSISLLLTGCIREECPAEERKLRTVYIYPIWEDGTKLPEGIRVYFFSLETKKFVQDNLDAKGGYTDIRDGQYSLLMLNNDSEKILFRNNTLYKTFEAYTNKLSPQSYVGPVPEEEAFDQPDNLWVAVIDTLIVSEVTKEIRLYPKPAIHQYYGWVEIENPEYVGLVRGAITGLQSSVKLSDKTTKDKPGTVFFSAQKSKAGITFAIRTFGVVQTNSTIGRTENHYLLLEFLQSHGTFRCSFDITETMKTIQDGDTIRIRERIVMPTDSTDINDNGFQAKVGDWDEVIYPIQL